MRYFNWLNKIQKLIRPASPALMYHRISNCCVDPWQLTVSPVHFEQQLQILHKTGRVKSLSHFQSSFETNYDIRPFILLTFDDGYIDNFMHVKPLLEKYELPATFFIPSKYMGQDREYWWDELAFIFLEKKVLPPFLTIIIGEHLKQYDLKGEIHINTSLMKLHTAWNANLNPPSKRAQVYLAIWKMLSPLPFNHQEDIMAQIRTWAEVDAIPREGYRVMSADQVNQLAKIDLFSIGAHTHSHPALPEHSKEFQAEEMVKNKEALQKLTGTDVESLAYPSGLYNDVSIGVAKSLGFKLAFTTNSQPLNCSPGPYQLGRYPVYDWSGARFSKQIKQY
ncbi:MAG TPA: polysaccharide deacetylase family protein [Chitinophagaceae bacterium]|nr:polysaccharide deacetylase family protein [Chitinophagaceae bacterium]